MLNNLLRKSRGFTLIEVVIVLAIAGLIFVIVFLAVSQAQASRRDTQRKNDLNRIAAALEQYASNNNGGFPPSSGAGAFNATSGNWADQHWEKLNFKDPSTDTEYDRNIGTLPGTCPAVDSTNPAQVYYSLTGRTYTLGMCMERGSTTVTNQ